MYWQLNSRVFSPRTRTKWQGSVTRESFLKTISCSRKLSTAEYKISLNENYKTDLSEKRDLHNENLRWRTKWSHSTDKNQWLISHRHSSSSLIRTFIPTWSQLLPFSWKCQCQLLPPNDLLEWCAELRRTYVPRWKQSYSQHSPWCMFTETYPSSFRISLSSTKISDVCN